MKKAYIFPGIGYSCDRSLLYFSGRLASECGYEIRKIAYTGFEQGIKGDKEKMERAFKLALSQTEETLRDERFEDADELLFISKSIGTVVAAAFERSHGLSGRNIYFTPLAETFDFAQRGSGIAFHGTSDPWADTGIIKAACSELDIPLYITENANHSLETGNAVDDIANLQSAMRTVNDYIRQMEYEQMSLY